jgi:hypothetical protein
MRREEMHAKGGDACEGRRSMRREEMHAKGGDACEGRRCMRREENDVNMHVEISGSHGSKYEYDCLLGCCAVQSGR